MSAIRPALADRPIYLDYHATTPVDPTVVEAMRPYPHDHFGNPSSGHSYGRPAHDALDVTYLPVDGHGLVDPADLAAAITRPPSWCR